MPRATRDRECRAAVRDVFGRLYRGATPADRYRRKREADRTVEDARSLPELARTQRKLWQAKARAEVPKRAVDSTSLEARIAELEAETNTAVSKLFGLTDEERMLVQDLVHVRRRLADGLVPADVVRKPKPEELDAYLRCLERALDHAIDENEARRHVVTVVLDGTSGMVRILKSLQRLWWTERQALADADHLVAEALTSAESSSR